MKRIASGNTINRIKSLSELANEGNSDSAKNTNIASPVEDTVDDNTFSQRLLRGITTILRSRLLMSIFTYNALFASTNVLLSFQRAALVVARNESSSAESDTAFLANINMASSVAIFALQASGVGALLASRVGSQYTLTLMPIVRLLGVLALAWWHRVSNGQPPNLILFLILDECTRVMNMAVAKPVRESLWRGLSNEARYEAKPIVDTLANRWGGGSAAFLVSFTDKMLDIFGVGISTGGETRTIIGFPPVLFLCLAISAWWAMASVDLGRIRNRIDIELKKFQ
jgi:ATP/ADP translocase